MFHIQNVNLQITDKITQFALFILRMNENYIKSLK